MFSLFHRHKVIFTSSYKVSALAFCLDRIILTAELVFALYLPQLTVPPRVNPDDCRRLCCHKVSGIERIPEAEGPHTEDRLGNLGEARRRRYKKLPRKPPSSLGEPSQFFKYQTKDDNAFNFERPVSASHPIPPTLLHYVFGKFLDDCQKYAPTREDNLLAHDLRSGMSEKFKDEKDRVKKLVDILSKYGIELRHSNIGSYRTDGDIQIDGFRVVIIEVKNELCAGKTDPLLQAIWYYQRSVGEGGQISKYPNSPLPCLLLYTFGSFSRLHDSS
jgi:hypothetical protein